MEYLAAFASVMRPFCHPDYWNVVYTHILQDLAHGGELALAAVDQDEIGPLTALSVRILPLEAREASLKHLAHHREIVARLSLGPLDVELAIVVFAKAL